MTEDIYTSLSVIVQNKLNEALSSELNCFLVKVTKTDGQYVSVKLTSQEKGFKDCEKIPIIQSPYFSPIVKVGDIGLALNIHIDIGNALNELPFNRNVFNQDYLVFLPLITKSQFKSNAEVLTITSSDFNSKIELSNDKLSTTCKSIETKANETYSLNAKSLTLEATGSDPLKIKNGAGSLADVIEQLFTCMDGLAAGLQGNMSNPGAYNGVKSGAKSTISKILG